MITAVVEVIQPSDQSVEIGNDSTFGITVSEPGVLDITIQVEDSSVLVEGDKSPKIIEINVPAEAGLVNYPEILEFEFTGSLLVGDPVTLLNDTVQAVSDNQPSSVPLGIFGLVHSILSPTRARVILMGRLSGFSALTPGSPYFLSDQGKLSSVAPTAGIVQQLGVAISIDTLFVNPQAAYSNDVTPVSNMTIDFSTGGDLSIDTGSRDNDASIVDSGLRIENGSI